MARPKQAKARAQLITKELGEKIPPLYANDGAEKPNEVRAVVKLFSIISNWTWYITEWDAKLGRLLRAGGRLRGGDGVLRPDGAVGDRRRRHGACRGAGPGFQAHDTRRDKDCDSGGIDTGLNHMIEGRDGVCCRAPSVYALPTARELLASCREDTSLKTHTSA